MIQAPFAKQFGDEANLDFEAFPQDRRWELNFLMLAQ
jgi:hypothetical protein